MKYEKEITVDEIRALLLISPEDDISEEINNLHCAEETVVELKDENNNLRDEVSMLKDKLKILGESLRKMTKDRNEIFFASFLTHETNPPSYSRMDTLTKVDEPEGGTK